MKWVNRFHLKADQSVVHEFTCTCPPDSHSHYTMVRGALRNMADDCYLEDGVPAEEAS